MPHTKHHLAKHDLRAPGAAVVLGVARIVLRGMAGLRLHDFSCGDLPVESGHEKFSQKVFGDLHDIGAGVESGREFVHVFHYEG